MNVKVSFIDAGDRQAKVEPEALKTASTDEFPTIKLHVRAPHDDKKPKYTLSGDPIEIVAESDGEELGEVPRPIQVEVPYDPEAFGGKKGSPSLFRYDEQEQDWLPLPTQIDRINHTLTAQLDSPAIVNPGSEDWEAARLPSLAAFQTSLYTGAATYSLPLELPPGPGGLQPNLTLSYNSQVVDSASNQTQASWVGMGWSLETGYIQRNMNGTPDYEGDDTFTLNFGGASYQLLPVGEGTDTNKRKYTEYKTVDDTFWRIRHYPKREHRDYWRDASGWMVWDKSGNRYSFNMGSHGPYYPDYNNCHIDILRYWIWPLTSVFNSFGQELKFEYDMSENKITNKCDTKPTDNADQSHHHMAVYPKVITYPHNRYRVVFKLIKRQDYETKWEGINSRVLFQRSLLKEISIEHDPIGDGSFEQIRKYVLTYESAPDKVIFPGLTWKAGGKTPTLVQVQEFGRDGAALPPTRFGYEDGRHLTWAENGYGGRVTFIYEEDAWHEVEGTEVRKKSIDLKIKSGSERPVFDPLDNFQPGGVYRIKARVKALTGGTFIRLGIRNGVDNIYAAHTPISTNQWKTIEVIVRLPAYSKSAGVGAISDGCHIQGEYTLTLLASRRRVIEKKVYNGLDPEPDTFTYRYDEPATNDPDHSGVVKNTPKENRYVEAYTEFRGHAMVQEVGPDGRVTTTWFHQDDARKGQAHTTTLTTQSFWDAFDALDSAAWQYTHADTQQTVERLRGDKAFKSYNPNADWNVQVQRTQDSIRDAEGFSNAVITQFRVSETQNKGKAWPVLALEGPTGSWRWGIVISANGSGGYKLDAQYNENKGWQYHELTSNFKVDTWYVLEMVVDDENGFMTRVWERDNPDAIYRYQRHMPQKLNWHFKQWSRECTVWLDTYSECRLFSETVTLHKADEQPVSILPKSEGNKQYNDLKIYWTRPLWEKSLTFEGRTDWICRVTEYQYAPEGQGGKQYGNVTQIIEKPWQENELVPYRVTGMDYYPTVTDDVYLVGLPGYRNQYRGSGGTARTSVWYLYDNHTRWNVPPTRGILTGQRTMLVRHHPSDNGPRFSDELYTHDEWGNRVSVTRFTEEGTDGTIANEGAQRTLTFYDGAYHTYPVTTINPLGHVTHTEYDYALGLPIRETDANGAVTTAEYDGFGRIRKVRKPGDETGDPTVQVVYYDNWRPFLVDVHKKPTNTAPGDVSVRKFYDGAGRLIQTQTPGAQLGEERRDIVVDMKHDAYGRVVQQTVPYDAPPWNSAESDTPYGGQQFDQPSTFTEYDALGRPLRVIATDKTEVQTAYSPSETVTIDPKGRRTVTKRDVWGRTIEVVPPLKPTAAYFYDELDRLVRVKSANAETAIEYDDAGRKTSMNDADMGIWRYRYDALGNLLRQTDARGQSICLYYDALNRLVGKHYRRDEQYPADPPLAITYSYDGERQHHTFDGNELPDGWGQQGNVTVSEGQAHITSNGTWSTHIVHSAYETGPLMARFTFRLDRQDAVAVLYLDSGPWANPDYRRWGVAITGGQIHRETFVGTKGDLKPLMPFQANVWYEALLVVGGTNRFRVWVWERDNPSVFGGLVETHADWARRDWHFVNQVHTGKEDFAEFIEQPLDNWQIGRRVAMNDASGATAWEYDARGRVTAEKKTIHDGGTFVTQWGYDNNDRPAWLQYPGGNEGQVGEKIEYRYHPHGPLNGMFSNLETYVKQTDYAACGKIRRQILGSGEANRGVLQSIYSYHPWTGEPGNSQGRLAAIQRGRMDDPTSLQDLHYTYDKVGNILTIEDEVAKQTQIFSYDELERITSAKAVGGEAGQYQESYAYNQEGLLMQKGEKAYAYQDPDHVHAVTHWNDLVKTITVRAKGTPVQGGWPQMQLWLNRRPLQTWEVNAVEYAEYSAEAVLSGRDEIAVFFSNDLYAPEDRNLFVDWIQVGDQRFEAEGPDVIYDRGEPFDNQDVIAGQENMFWQGGLRLTVETAPAAFGYDANGSMVRRQTADEVQVLNYDAENRMAGVLPQGVQPAFDDVPVNHWAFAAIETLAKAGTVSGCQADPPLYCPEHGLTRAEIAVFILRGVHGPDYTPDPPTEQRFADVPLDAWYAKWAEAIYIQGYSKGCGQNPLRYCPEQTLTRAESAVFFLRLKHGQEYTPPQPTEPLFADVPLNAWYAKWAHAAYEQGLMPADQLEPALRFGPNRPASRALAAHMLVQAKGLAMNPTPAKANFIYDGNGNRVKGTVNGVRTTYPGGHYEVQGNTVKQYYAVGGLRIVMRENSTLYWLLTDHLGSTSVTTNADGSQAAELHYRAFGETRYGQGTAPTSYGYTGQRQEVALDLYYYRARWYAPTLGRFTQADTIVPEINKPLSMDRFAYVTNNPLKYNDLSGHSYCDNKYALSEDRIAAGCSRVSINWDTVRWRSFIRIQSRLAEQYQILVSVDRLNTSSGDALSAILRVSSAIRSADEATSSIGGYNVIFGDHPSTAQTGDPTFIKIISGSNIPGTDYFGINRRFNGGWHIELALQRVLENGTQKGTNLIMHEIAHNLTRKNYDYVNYNRDSTNHTANLGVRAGSYDYGSHDELTADYVASTMLDNFYANGTQISTDVMEFITCKSQGTC